MLKCVPGLVLILASLSLGQVNLNSVTVTSSRNASLPPDQAVFSVTVNSGINTSVNDVVAALQGSGITLANFASVSTQNGLGSQTAVQWSFRLIAPLSSTKDTIAMLTGLQQSLTQQKHGLTLSFAVQGTQVSQQALQSQTCAIADLIADTRSQAQTLAAASGRALSGILAMSSLTSTSPVCTLTVKFALLGS